MQQLLGEEPIPALDPDECHNKFKVMASQFKHFSITKEIPRSLLFYKKSRIVAPPSIQSKLMADGHGTGHIGVTKTYN